MKTQGISSGTFQLDPFHEKLILLETRVKKIKKFSYLVSELCGHEKAKHKEDKELLSDLFLSYFGFEFEKEKLEECRMKLMVLQPGLLAFVTVVDELFESIDHSIQRVKAIFSGGDYNVAVRTLLQIEKESVEPLEELMLLFERMIYRRFTRQGWESFELVDLAMCELFGSILSPVNEKIPADMTRLGLPPVVFSTTHPELPGRWMMVQRALLRHGRSLPIELIPLAEQSTHSVWNLVDAYREGFSSLYRVLPIQAEWQHLIERFMLQFGASQQALAAYQSWARDLFAEIGATLVAGPAYLGASLENFADTAAEVMSSKERMPAYLRWMISLATLKQLGFAQETAVLQQAIFRLYGPPEFALQVPSQQPVIFAPQHAMKECAVLAELLVSSLIETPLITLQGRRIKESVLIYDMDRHKEAHRVAEWLLISKTVGADVAEIGDAQKKGAKPTKSADAAKIEVTSISTLFSGVRIAFERLITTGSIEPEFESLVVRRLLSASRNLFVKDKARRLKRSLSAEEIQRIIRSGYTMSYNQSVQ